MRTPIKLAVIILLCWASAAFAANCTISGPILNIDGTVAANATITLNPVTPQPLTTGGSSYTSQPISAVTDANGNITPFTLPQGLFVQVTIYENGANFGGYTVRVPFMAAATFTQLNQGITTQSLDALAASDPPTGPLNMNGQLIQNAGCPGTPGDVLVWGCGNNLGPLAITGNLDFGQYSALNVGGVGTIQQPAPTSITIQATCSGTCATLYTYQVTCVTAIGETTGTTVTATNAAQLNNTNNNNISWPLTPAACSAGFNIYGRIGGSLGLLANVPSGQNSFTDNGSISAPADIYTITWSAPAYPVIAMWDMRTTPTAQPINARSGSQGSSRFPSVGGLTTTLNNSLEIATFGLSQTSGTFTPPVGFSNTISVSGVSNTNYAFWGGTKNIPTATTTGTVSGTAAVTGPWAAINMAISPANPATPITLVSTLHPTVSAPYTSVTFGDSASTQAGDLQVICVGFKQSTTITVPSSFTLIGSQTYVTGNVQLACYWNLPAGPAGIPPPTINSTGAIIETLSNGTTTNISQQEAHLSGTGLFGNNTNFPTGNIVNQAIATKAGHFVNLVITTLSLNGTACSTTAPTFNVFAGSTATGTAEIASQTVQNTRGVANSAAQSLAFHAGDVIGIYISAQGSSCNTPTFGIDAAVNYP